MRLPLVAAVALCVGACSSVQTRVSEPAVKVTAAEQRYQLLVRTGNAHMDSIVYELVYQQFSDALPLREKEPYTGTLEVTFASATQSMFTGTSVATGSASASGYGWYNGSGYAGGASVTGTGVAVTSGTSFDWQNSTMLMVLKDTDGARLWSADYNYKGGWEWSGFSVNTPEEAARLVSKRLRAQFAKDYHIKTSRS